MAIVRGLAVMFDGGPDRCCAFECAMEEDGNVLEARAIRACHQRPVMIWLGLAGLCADHAAQMRLDPNAA